MREVSSPIYQCKGGWALIPYESGQPVLLRGTWKFLSLKNGRSLRPKRSFDVFFSASVCGFLGAKFFGRTAPGANGAVWVDKRTSTRTRSQIVSVSVSLQKMRLCWHHEKRSGNSEKRLMQFEAWWKQKCWMAKFVRQETVEGGNASHDLRRILDISFGSERPMVASTVSLSQSFHISTHNWGH